MIPGKLGFQDDAGLKVEDRADRGRRVEEQERKV